jgi:hypothetical protein
MAVLVAIGLVVRFRSRPPSEAALITNFKNHRATYERLRDMLAGDDHLLRIADWGVETDSGLEEPHAGTFPALRYDEYLALLREVDAKGASRGGGKTGVPCVLVWASGFAADTRHRSICWLTQQPENQVASLDEFESTPKPRKPVYEHIDTGWYIWADW